MKKSILVLGMTAVLVSCGKTEQKTEKSEFKTAYIDTAKLLDNSEKFKDEDEKFKVKSQELSRPLEARLKAFQNEVANFQRNAQANGMAWAQQKDTELRQREQRLAMEQEALLRQIQIESDSVRKDVIDGLKNYIKEYGKKNGYDYIYGTGDAATVLYAKDAYDITDEILKLLNDEFKASNGSKKPKEEKKK